jgi:hypothetical protein
VKKEVINLTPNIIENLLAGRGIFSFSSLAGTSLLGNKRAISSRALAGTRHDGDFALNRSRYVSSTQC